MKSPSLTVATSQYAPADVYCKLRDQVLRFPREPAGADMVCVLMETGYAEAVATLVVLADGTTSLYFSNGGGIIGAGKHKPIAAARAAFLTAAKQNVAMMQPATAFPLPGLNRTRFYILSAGGARTAEAVENDLGNNREKLSPLFHLGHAVIAAVRENTKQT